MAYPVLQKRGDIVLKTDFTGGATPTYTNFCGATQISMSVDNAVSETQVGNCEDWRAPIKTVAAYQSQTVTVSINAHLSIGNRSRLIRWGVDQLVIPLQFLIVNAEVGEIEKIEGLGMLPGLNVDNIFSTADGATVTAALNIRFQDGVTLTNKV